MHACIHSYMHTYTQLSASLALNLVNVPAGLRKVHFGFSRDLVVYVYGCMHVNIYVIYNMYRTNIYIYIYINIYTHMYMCAYVCTCKHVCVYV